MDELLHAGRARIRRDLEMIELPPCDRLPVSPGLLDVVVIGAGRSGPAIAFGLMRQGIRRLLVLDRAPRGREAPWRSHATIGMLCSPKTRTGPDLGLPNFTSRACSRHGVAPGPGRVRQGWRAPGSARIRIITSPIR
jgi:hypothetical protein